MKLDRLIVLFVAALAATSCSQKSGADPGETSKTEAAKPEPELATAKSASTNDAAPTEASDRDKQSAEGETEARPAEDEIAEDCVAFLRSTKTVPAATPGACPTCPGDGKAAEVLKFDSVHVDHVACVAERCEIDAELRGTFNPSTREPITGGLTAWISPQQRAQWLNGDAPPGQQVFKVKITYRKNGNGWRAIEFDRADRK